MILDLSYNKKISNARHWYTDINQFYHPTSKFKQDSVDLVYSFETLNTTKFVQILLKEWFYLVKKDGNLVIDYKPNKICDMEKLENLMQWLWKGKYKITFHDYIDDLRLRFICKKTSETLIKDDDITRWTFGIITNGKRREWINLIIDSIREQGIPNYEIVICGSYAEKLGKDLKYIPFSKFDNRGWITKKKNSIVKKAKYENICMLHDRIILGKDWYKGMRKWGNCFENLGCKQLFKGKRVNDWLVSHYFIRSKEHEDFSFESYIEYKDWYPETFFSGQLNIFKKSILKKSNLWWDEKLFYGQKEDYYFSLNLYKNGFIHRFNSFSEVETLTNKYVDPTYIRYNAYSLEPKMILNNNRAFLKIIAFYILKLLSFMNIHFSFSTLENIRGKIYTFILMFNPARYSYNKEWRKVIK